MAILDIYADYVHNLADDGTISTQPAGTVEATIHNIYHDGDCEIYLSGGGNSTLMESPTGVGVEARHFHVKNGQFIVIKNISGSTGGFGYDGVETHV